MDATASPAGGTLLQAVDRIVRFSSRYHPRPIASSHQVLVYVDRRGELFIPDGGLTSGQIFLRRPATCYIVGLSPRIEQHDLDLVFPHAILSPVVQLQWHVHDPAAVVANLPTKVSDLAVTALSKPTDQIMNRATPRQAVVFGALMSSSEPIVLKQGITITRWSIMDPIRMRFTEGHPQAMGAHDWDTVVDTPDRAG